jgi:hypothetical protein
MCFGASSSKSDGGMSSAHKSMHSGSNNTAHENMMSSASKEPKDTPVTRPKARTGNAYTVSKGKRINPSLLQRVLDTSPTYKAVSYLGRRFDPRG